MKPTIEYDPADRNFNSLFRIADRARNMMKKMAKTNEKLLSDSHGLELQAEEEAGCMMRLLQSAKSFEDGLMIIANYVSLYPANNSIKL